MIFRERVPLAELTTFRIGGPAELVAECGSVEDVKAAVMQAHDRGLPFAVLGSGSNILASDAGFAGIALLMRIPGIDVLEDAEQSTLLSVGGGVEWDAFVHEAAARGLWGIENLAGIPGTVGAAPVQNIGAYGSEAAETIEWVEVYDTKTGEVARLLTADCGFGYRESRFKHDPMLIITRVAFRLGKVPAPRISYADLARAAEAGVVLDTPAAIGEAVRGIRSRKFPDLALHGTAGSFFKNPVITQAAYDALLAQYPELPSFPAVGGVKVPLAFILDRVLAMRGYTEGRVQLFANQPLVLVAEFGAREADVQALAAHVEARILDATGITIAREVRSMPSGT